MNYLKLFSILFLSLSLSLMISCKKKQECDPPGCGLTGYRCVDGKCICPEDMFEVNGNCIINYSGSYLGTYDCGCYNDLIITLTFDGEDRGGIHLYEGSGVHSTSFSKDDKGNYYALLMKRCTWNDIQTDFVQFEIEVVEEGQIWVTAKWTKQFGLEVAYECSALFID